MPVGFAAARSPSAARCQTTSHRASRPVWIWPETATSADPSCFSRWVAMLHDQPTDKQARPEKIMTITRLHDDPYYPLVTPLLPVLY